MWLVNSAKKKKKVAVVCRTDRPPTLKLERPRFAHLLRSVIFYYSKSVFPHKAFNYYSS